MENHITREQFLFEFFGFFGRDFGNPERWFTDNPSDIFPFIEECAIVDAQLEEDKIRSVEYFKLYGLKQKDLLYAMDKARELEKTRKQKQIKYVPRSLTFESFNGIRPCFVKAMDSGEMCHMQRLGLLKEAYFLGFHSPESIINIFRCFNDFDYSITSYQVNWFITHWVENGENRPFSCRTIQKHGWCLGDECPRLKHKLG